MKKGLCVAFGASLLVLAPLSFITNIAYTLTLPKEYAGRVTLQVVFPEGMTDRYDETALHVLTGTQVEVIRSTPILNQVIEDLGLSKKWGEFYNDDEPLPVETVRLLLKRDLQVEAIPKTSGLISIEVRRQDPEEAALIANRIAQVYHEKVAKTPQQGGSYRVAIINPAKIEKLPVYPNVLRNILVAFGFSVGCLALGLLLIYAGSRSSPVPRIPPIPPIPPEPPSTSVSTKTTARPMSVSLIAWFWIVVGAIYFFWGTVGVGFMVLLLREAMTDPEMTPDMSIMWTVLGALAVLVLLAATATISGTAFLRCKAWSRKVLEAITWLDMGFMTCFAAWWMWALITDERPMGTLQKTIGVILGLMILAGMMAPLVLIVRALRGEVVKRALQGDTHTTCEGQ